MTLTQFLEALAVDPDLEAQFEEVPVYTMVASGVNADDRELILNGSIEDIRRKVAEDQSDATVFVIRVKMR